jgi:hypothetical protein
MLRNPKLHLATTDDEATSALSAGSAAETGKSNADECLGKSSTSVGLVLYVLLKRISSRRSYVYLEIRSAKSYVQLRLAKLSHFNRKSAIVIPREQLTIELSNYYAYSVLTIKPRTMKMFNTLANESKELVTYIVVPTRTTRQLLIIRTEYSVTSFIVHSQENILMQEQYRQRKILPKNALIY